VETPPLDFEEMRAHIESNDEAAPPPAPDSPAQHVSTVQAGVMNPGPPPPGTAAAQPISAEEQAFANRLDSHVNHELNIFNACYSATKNLVAHHVSREPLDAAEVGAAQFEAGKRTPLELAEPQLAIEVFRQVRHSMREEDKNELGDALKALKKLLGGGQ